jgi:hypothetical protein
MQIVNGEILGSPGPVGSPPICHLYGSGSPANSTDPNVANCALSSLYHDYTTPGLWFKSAVGTWTQITIP